MARQKTTTDVIRDNLIRAIKGRELRAVEAAETVAADFDRIAKAVVALDPKLEASVLALGEIVEFLKAIRGQAGAIAGHAAEGAAGAKDHAEDMAHVATLSINVPEILRDDTNQS